MRERAEWQEVLTQRLEQWKGVCVPYRIVVAGPVARTALVGEGRSTARWWRRSVEGCRRRSSSRTTWCVQMQSAESDTSVVERRQIGPGGRAWRLSVFWDIDRSSGRDQARARSCVERVSSADAVTRYRDGECGGDSQSNGNGRRRQETRRVDPKRNVSR